MVNEYLLPRVWIYWMTCVPRCLGLASKSRWIPAVSSCPSGGGPAPWNGDGRQRKILLMLPDLTRKVFQGNGICVIDFCERSGSLFNADRGARPASSGHSSDAGRGCLH